jgi:hypothetical protein
VRPPVEEPRSGWRWAAIAVALLLAVVVAGAWNKHRAAQERERDEAAKVEAERSAEYRGDLEQSAAMRQRAEDEMRRLSTPPSGPITLDPRSPPPAAEAPAVVPTPAQKPAMVAVEPQPPSFRDRPGRDRDDRPGPPPDDRDKMDKMRGTEQEFRAADSNGDGYLTPGEVRGRFPLLEREFQRVDENGDGRISPQELHQFKRVMTEMPPFKKKW